MTTCMHIHTNQTIMSSKLALLLKQSRDSGGSGGGQDVRRHRQRADATTPPGGGDPPHAAPPAKRPKHAAASTQHQQQHSQQSPHHRQPGGYSSRGAAAAAATAGGAGGGAGLDDDDADAPAGQAYSALVSALSRQRGQLGAVLKQQRAQQAGLSDTSGSGSESEQESEGSEVDEGSGQQAGGEPAASSEEDAGASGEGEDGDDAAAAAAAAAGGGEQGRQQQQQQQLRQLGNGAAADAAANGSSSSHWEGFMSRELSEAEAAALRAGGSSVWQEAAADAAVGGGGDPSEGLWPRARWQFAGQSGFPPAPQQLAAYGVKERLTARWREVAQEEGRLLTDGDFATPQQRLLFSLCDSYADVFHAAKPYPGRSSSSSAGAGGAGAGGAGAGGGAGDARRRRRDDDAMDAVLLHLLNHCAKAADAIKKNNDKAKALEPGAVSDIPRDQGFTRPKALLMLPLRSMAFRWVTRLVGLAQRETRADSVQGKEKFVEQFIGDEDDDESDEDESDVTDGQKKRKGVAKPAEHRALFRGNLDDHFRLGIRITRGQIKLFADPLQSDIIVASPLALATKLAEDAAAARDAADGAAGGGGGRRGGGRGGRGGGRGRGRRGGGAAGAAAGGRGGGGASSSSSSGGAADFLSSIEICVLERADVLLMQNWQHVNTVLAALNQQPASLHGVNVMRVRMHHLEGRGALYRQTIMTSSFATPQLNAAFARHCSSHAGKFRLLAQPTGVLSQVVPQVRQLFERFESPSHAAVADARFDAFRAQLWPRLAEGGGGGLLLVVPSYFDFLRLRSFLKAEEADFSALSEYSEFADVTRARARFYQRHTRLLLYTERAHFYHRYRIRGIQDIVFYGLPDHAHFYAELVNLVQTGGAAAGGHHATITSLFCAFDALALGRVVGASRAAKMLTPGSSPTFVFC